MIQEIKKGRLCIPLQRHDWTIFSKHRLNGDHAGGRQENRTARSVRATCDSETSIERN